MPKRTAVITGGSRGIGKAIVEVLRQQGIEVIAPTRTELDLASPASIDAWCARHATITTDILINNAGINTLGAISELEDSAWDTMEQINLRAPLRLMRAVVPGMVRRGWGRVVNITSVWAHVARERRGGYAATKAAISAVTRTLAVECGGAGVLVNALSPGFVATELTRQNNSPAELDAICTRIPLARLAEPHEIAHAVAWLASESNTYITGQTIIADGGYTAI